MSEELSACLSEILTDENGNTITPTCGIEKLLKTICETISNGVSSGGGSVSEIDGGYPDSEY